jgi:preprotein translocase subunit SecG
MITVVLVIHLLIATALVGVILLQRSEGGALSGLGGGNFGGLMSARGSANLLTRATAILAACFILTSVVLALLASHGRNTASILDRPGASAPAGVPAPANQSQPSAPAAQPGQEAPPAGSTTPAPAPAQPAEPQAPVAR